MGFPTFLAVLGIFITVLFGIWGIYCTIRRRYPGQITFVAETVIALFDEITKNLPKLAVLYQGTPVSPNLILISGGFVNTGNKDIAPSMVEKPISLQLPKNCKWLEATVISASPNLSASFVQKEDWELEVSSNLLRRKEFIRFQALAEVPPPPSGEDQHKSIAPYKLRFDHRIQDTQPVREVELQNPEWLRKRIKKYFFLFIGFFLGFLIAFFYTIHDGSNYFVYEMRIEPTKSAFVAVEPQHNSNIRIWSTDGKIKQTLPLKDFLTKSVGGPNIIQDYRHIYLVGVFSFIVYFLAPLCFFSIRYFEYRTNLKLGRLLGIK